MPEAFFESLSHFAYLDVVFSNGERAMINAQYNLQFHSKMINRHVGIFKISASQGEKLGVALRLLGYLQCIDSNLIRSLYLYE